MKFARDYRYEAQNETRPQQGAFVVILLIYALINAVINFSYQEQFVLFDQTINVVNKPLSFLSFLIGYHLIFSFTFIAKKVHFGNKISIKDLFVGFRDYVRILVAHILEGLYLLLWEILFALPGIIGFIVSFIFLGQNLLEQFVFAIIVSSILTLVGSIFTIQKSYSYKMIDFILLENSNLSSREAISLSKELMSGYRWRLFCLELSYIGWLFVCVLTLGIFALVVVPRQHQAKYLFFKDVYEENGYSINSLDDDIQVSYL